MRRSWLFVLAFCGWGVWMLVATSCGNNDQTCNKDYNCPNGQVCVGLVCQALKEEPVQEKATEKPAADSGTPESSTEPTPEQPPKDEGAGSQCSKNDDCKDPGKQYCKLDRCSAGWFDFQFTEGHPVIQLPFQSAQCTSNAQCPNWQACNTRSRRCTPRINTKAKANVKLNGLSYFMSGYSYSTQELVDSGQIVRTTLLGEFSDKLQRLLEIDVPFDKMKAGTFTVGGPDIKVSLYDNFIEFVPARKVLVGVGYAGTVTFSRAGNNLGNTVAGNALVLLKKP